MGEMAEGAGHSLYQHSQTRATPPLFGAVKVLSRAWVRIARLSGAKGGREARVELAADQTLAHVFARNTASLSRLLFYTQHVVWPQSGRQSEHGTPVCRMPSREGRGQPPGEPLLSGPPHREQPLWPGVRHPDLSCIRPGTLEAWAGTHEEQHARLREVEARR